MDISIYENKLPVIDENVLVIFTEYKDTHIEAELIEYNSIKGMMIYEDATRKKKVYDWKKEVPLNKIIVAKVEEIFSDTYVKLSIRYFDQKLDSTELKKQLMKPFLENKVILTTIKKICRNNNLDFNDFWSKVIYKLNNKKRNDDINQSLLDYISENVKLFNNTIIENYSNNYENIINEYNKLILNKIYKIQTKFSLTTTNSIEDIKNILKFVCNDNKDWEFTLKYESTPLFILESSSENSTIENHELFLKLLEQQCVLSENKISYQKLN
jgi:translation initiation factor 2 alpha subunit (eIF-2alpha)